MMEKLQVGEKYLRIELVGHNPVSAFKNKEKKGNQPDFRGAGVSVWVNVKREKKLDVSGRVVEEDLF